MIQLKKEIKEYAVKNGILSSGVERVDDYTEYKAALDKLINNFTETDSLYSLMYNRTLFKE